MSTPNNFATFLRVSSGNWAGPINSTPSLLTWAKKFIGSMQAWDKKGAWYSRVITLAAVLKTASTSPSLRKGFTSVLSSNCFIKRSWSVVLSTAPSGSYSTFSTFRALVTCHVDLPNTATLSLKMTTSTMPGMALAAATSTDFILVPNGGRSIMANNIPSR